MKNILYCEDDIVIRDSVNQILKIKLAGHNFILASDIEEALNQIKGKQLDLAVTDGSLFGEDTGWDLVDRLRETGYVGPAIYVGAAAIPEDKKNRFSSILIKPVEPSKLIEKIKEYV